MVKVIQRCLSQSQSVCPGEGLSRAICGRKEALMGDLLHARCSVYFKSHQICEEW